MNTLNDMQMPCAETTQCNIESVTLCAHKLAVQQPLCGRTFGRYIFPSPWKTSKTAMYKYIYIYVDNVFTLHVSLSVKMKK